MISLSLLLFPTIYGLNNDGYFGIPIGSLFDKQARLSADVFIADDHTIAFDKFFYQHRGKSCMAIMLGPAREDEKERKVGPGILVRMSKMNFKWEEPIQFWRRKKRGNEREKIGIDEMINTLQLTNPRWRIRLNAATLSTPNYESYEVVEYEENEEETEEHEEQIPLKSETVIHHIVHQLASKPSSSSSEWTTKPITITTTKPMIIFDKKNSFETAQVKKLKRFPKPPEILSDENPSVFSRTTTTNQPTMETMTTEFVVLEEIERSTDKGLIQKDVSPFLIPATDNERTTFLLTNGAKITDYKWLGLWNQCTNESTPHIWLAGVDPPREEQISPLMDTNGFPISESVRILNCNTLLIPKLYFNPDPNRLSTYFYGGTVDGTKIEKTMRIKVIGYDIGEPLEEFIGDDIMLRLPKGVRTFDIDFILIFNEDDGKALAKTEIPSTLVPPCND